MSLPEATILFTTKNRCDDLRRALRSAEAQRGAVIEILVIDDGSTDETSKMINTEFPSVRLERREESRGLVVRRNEGAGLAKAPIVFSLDDDAMFSDSRIVAETLMEFDHPRFGAVAIPFVNVLKTPEVFQRAPDEEKLSIFVTDAYIGTAHALRRDLFLQIGGYREHLFHQGEESDYCVRLLATGHIVLLGRSEPIHHYESPRRSTKRMDYYGRRNDILYAWHNVPMPDFAVHLAGTILNGLRAALQDARHPGRMLLGAFAGCLACLRYWSKRRPVSRSIYRLSRRLKKQGPWTLAAIEGMLPPPTR